MKSTLSNLYLIQVIKYHYLESLNPIGNQKYDITTKNNLVNGLSQEINN